MSVVVSPAMRCAQWLSPLVAVALLASAGCGSSGSPTGKGGTGGAVGGAGGAASDASRDSGDGAAASDARTGDSSGSSDDARDASSADAMMTGDAQDAPASSDAGSPDGSLNARYIYRLPIAGEQLVADPLRRRLYATVAGAAAVYPNTLVTVDATNGAVLSSPFVGSDPRALAISDDASTLWVGIDGALSIRRVTLGAAPPQPADLGSLHQVPQQPGMPTVATSMAVMAGAPATVALSLRSISAWETAVLDDAVPRAAAVTTIGRISSGLIAGPAGYFFGLNNDLGLAFLTNTVSATGITTAAFTNALTTAPSQMVFAGGRVFTGAGDVVNVSNPAQPAAAGHFTPTGTIALGAPNRLVVVPNGGPILFLDATTFQTIVPVPYPADLSGSVRSVVYIAPDAVAMLVAHTDPQTFISTVSMAVVRDPLITLAN